MKVFKFSGTSNNMYGTYRNEFSGYFIKQVNDEIIGTMHGEEGDAFIKGLFINNSQLIFIEMTTIKNGIYGYSFNNINEVGLYDICDWLSGLFSGELERIEARIKIEETADFDGMNKEIEKNFQSFYESLDDWEKYYFEHVQKLREYLDIAD